jgi:hypothetical protein
MRYLLLIASDDSGFATATQEQIAETMAAYNAFTRDARESGVMVGGEGLQPVSTAKTVRVRDGETLVTDGPFAETKEQIGGYYLVDVPSEKEALEWAAKIPGARFDSIEVRPVMDYPPDGAS